MKYLAIKIPHMMATPFHKKVNRFHLDLQTFLLHGKNTLK